MGIPTFMMFDAAPDACAPYSHVVESDGWLWITGQMPNYPDDHAKPLPDGIEAQTRNVMHNLEIVLGELGIGFGNVVQTRAFLTEFKRDYESFNGVYKSYFEPGKLPARTCIGVTALALDALVEVDFVARRP
ncbi:MULTISPECIES: RidA family protein [Mycobacterium ulcerans group]|uniref:Translation initiation inhibitor n=4 Tax=Mycobacterium TaxID=1763 RepID=B2HRX9_MYCMM|nr:MULTISPECIES: RidA family protein [Mycobacterium ulcerans group]AGC62147.1 translation initiation inhibitor [Mycobacterium liflandii 128FXT]ULL10436.1 RidA family protein [Mycobacterium liflandii]ACC41009.1 translation initiation inhibitor [Mycobacterium marinum M]EPQ76333.1 translation initiation inhibitor [Mycobacterium marinum MB2]MDC8975000.1 RidA family protein [Mycobacterium marinum]